ncbi:MAG: hypothetical protein AAF199_06915 [Pseudomonadota bacterium]
MHYIIGILGAIAGLFWAFTHFSNAARQGKDAVDEVHFGGNDGPAKSISG